MIKITSCVITLNEERSIERCLKSLSFSDEVVVVDAGSTDKTVEIAKSFGAKVIVHPWNGFAEQRNQGLKACSGDWVFFIDADECASVELGQLLKKISNENKEQHPHCYSIKRNEYFLGQLLEYGPGNPSYQWRFFKRDQVKFYGEVHEYPKFDGGVGKIEASIDHWPDLDIDRFLKKLNHYTTIEALDRFAQGQRTSLIHAFATFFSTFLKNGFRYRGFLNGRVGLILILLESFSRVVRHLKLWVYWQVYEKKLNLKLGVKLPVPGSAASPLKSELEKPVVKAAN